MLPIILVLLFATSALAAPTVQVILNSIDEVPPEPSNGRPIGAFLLTNAFDVIDGGEKNVNIHYLLDILPQMSNLPDKTSQAAALAQAVAIMIELSTGYPGDACVTSNFIDFYVNAIRSGNVRAARAAAASHVRGLASVLNSITQVVLNPVTSRFANGRRGTCQAGGAAYQFEAAWDIASSNAASADLFQEQYCAVKRLYNGFSAISRNVGAAATAAALPDIIEIVKEASGALVNLLVAVGSGSGNIVQATSIAQQALISAANNHS
ncbi:unnamed protein product [Arctia plantaginis]|uniref:Fibroin light chain n=1 Tax=Arctia plantaginis TaxID=874455 RepID=A0A8S0Z4Z0_ARCPL|nr:unnamed protein product [Arctia plantaginis]